ncbi:MAG: porin family protein [Endomicrobia bacterium]|nr:porin family protein [Endomicrobiia bacterium]
MKKLVLAVAAVVIMAGAAFAEGEINVKLGLDVAGTYSVDGGRDIDMNTGVNIQGEYLAVASDILKIGGGLQYLLPRNADGVSGDAGLSFLPIYATVEVNPIKSAKEVFFKANLGYGLVIPEDSDFSTESGLYYAIGAGYNFPSGLILDISYAWHAITSGDADATYNKLGLNAGWKFKI